LVRIHIETLVLHGFAPGERYALGDAVHQELTRLVAEHGMPPVLARRGVREHIDAGSFTVAPGRRAAAIGAQVAQAIHGGAKP
jgi:hypothetical protein